ncbi:MAG: type II toxin-antitoxin system VapC family toxin [Actinomycetota bacterium]|nr:type II toxin-antitoxin system VapC family toxin [Actinomycetota bacterium]
MAYYVDTSALTKLVVAEPETKALRAWFAAADRQPVASDLTRTELLRAVRRAAPGRMVHARAVLDSLVLLQATTDTFEAAALLDPTLLRTLDAIHLATALTLGDELEGLVAYDDRLAHAAQALGILVLHPGAT